MLHSSSGAKQPARPPVGVVQPFRVICGNVTPDLALLRLLIWPRWQERGKIWQLQAH